MRLSYLSTSTIPSQKANAVHVMKMCHALALQGNEVKLWCLDGNSKKSDKEICEQYGVEQDFEIVRIGVASFLKKLVPEFILISFLSGFKYMFGKNADDAMYARSKLALFMVKGKRPYIMESHIPPRNGLLKYIEKKIIFHRNFRKLVVISNELKKNYMELFPRLSEEKIAVLHDATNLDETVINENVELITPGRFNVGYIGHLYPGKCMEVLLPIAQRTPNYTYHIVGGTAYWVDYWKKEAETQKLKNIVFYGFVDNKCVQAYYKKFDIVILPFSEKVYVGKKSEIASFFSPLKLFEAMGCRKAIVVSKLPTIEEIVDDNVNGLLCDVNSVDSWISAMERLERDSAFRMQMEENAYEKIRMNYTWNKRAEKIMGFLDE